MATFPPKSFHLALQFDHDAIRAILITGLIELNVNPEMANTLLTPAMSPIYGIVATLYINHGLNGLRYRMPMLDISNKLLPKIPDNAVVLRWVYDRILMIGTVIQLSGITDLDTTDAIKEIVNVQLASFMHTPLPIDILHLATYHSTQGYGTDVSLTICAIIWQGLITHISDINISHKLYGTLFMANIVHYTAIIKSLLHSMPETDVLYKPYNSFLAAYQISESNPYFPIISDTQASMNDIIICSSSSDDDERATVPQLIDDYMAIYTSYSSTNAAIGNDKSISS